MADYFFSPLNPSDPNLPRTIKRSTRTACVLVGAIGTTTLVTATTIGLAPIVISAAVLGTMGLGFWMAKREFTQKIDCLRHHLRHRPMADMPDFKITPEAEKLFNTAFNWKIATGTVAGGAFAFLIDLPSDLEQKPFRFFPSNSFFLALTTAAAVYCDSKGNEQIDAALEKAGWKPPQIFIPPPRPPGAAPS